MVGVASRLRIFGELRMVLRFSMFAAGRSRKVQGKDRGTKKEHKPRHGRDDACSHKSLVATEDPWRPAFRHNVREPTQNATQSYGVDQLCERRVPNAQTKMIPRRTRRSKTFSGELLGPSPKFRWRNSGRDATSCKARQCHLRTDRRRASVSPARRHRVDEVRCMTIFSSTSQVVSVELDEDHFCQHFRSSKKKQDHR